MFGVYLLFFKENKFFNIYIWILLKKIERGFGLFFVGKVFYYGFGGSWLICVKFFVVCLGRDKDFIIFWGFFVLYIGWFRVKVCSIVGRSLDLFYFRKI